MAWSEQVAFTKGHQGLDTRDECKLWLLNSLILTASSQIVVERLTKNVNEDHLREIFGHYGEIEDLDMPMNRQCG